MLLARCEACTNNTSDQESICLHGAPGRCVSVVGERFLSDPLHVQALQCTDTHWTALISNKNFLSSYKKILFTYSPIPLTITLI